MLMSLISMLLYRVVFVKESPLNNIELSMKLGKS